MALRVWPNIQMSADRKEPTIPTAASDSIPKSFIFPTTAASVAESTGSAIPEISAGMASCWMRLKEISVRTILKGKTTQNAQGQRKRCTGND
jgi:hypothetical protein